MTAPTGRSSAHPTHSDFKRGILSDKDIIKLHFSATLVPLNSHARIYRPKIYAPEGVQLLDSKYFVGHVEVPPGDEKHRSFSTIDKISNDELVVLYQITNRTIMEIEDDHSWPCPVLDYSVIFETSEGFKFEVSKIMPGDEFEMLKNKVDKRNSTITFLGDGAAFTRQGVVWKLIRNKLVA